MAQCVVPKHIINTSSTAPTKDAPSPSLTSLRAERVQTPYVASAMPAMAKTVFPAQFLGRDHQPPVCENVEAKGGDGGGLGSGGERPQSGSSIFDGG
ncbi:hypothetical protein JCM24511_05828 [Saitozyma sp. JCM 24511]|nr:hypothetical protein JCM24511_05828 [Saitozyma sp. JCM 24511]